MKETCSGFRVRLSFPFCWEESKREATKDSEENVLSKLRSESSDDNALSQVVRTLPFSLSFVVFLEGVQDKSV